MSFVNIYSNSSYAKITGISIFIHCVLFIVVLLLGAFASAEIPPEVVAVEIVSAVVPDSAVKEPESSPPPAQQTAPQPQPQMSQQALMQERTLPAALPQESSSTSVGISASVGAMSGDMGAPYSGPGTAGGTGIVGSTGSGQTGTGGGGGKRTGSSWTYNPKPHYPEGARQVGWEGAVNLRVRIETDGSVTVLSANSERSDATQAAAQIVGTWQATPAHDDDGTPVAITKNIRVKFDLMDS